MAVEWPLGISCAARRARVTPQAFLPSPSASSAVLTWAVASAFLGWLQCGDVKPFGFVLFPTGRRFFLSPFHVAFCGPPAFAWWDVSPCSPESSSLNLDVSLTVLCFNHCLGIFSSFGAVLLGAEFSQQPFRAAEVVCPEKTCLYLGNLECWAPQQCNRRVCFFCCLLLGLVLPEIVAHVKHFHEQFQYHKRYSWQQHLAHFLSFFAISGRKLSLHFFCLYLCLSSLNTDSIVSAVFEPLLRFCLHSPTAGSSPVPPLQSTSSSSFASRSHPILSLQGFLHFGLSYYISSISAG